jgi:hypothetical protein
MMIISNRYNKLGQKLNIYIMDKLTKNVIMEGVFASEVVDTAGEVLKIDGADISELQSGKAVLNTEHVNPEDLKENIKKDEPGAKGFDSIVGRIIGAKKIYGPEDCKSKNELNAWNNIKKPMIYGQVEIWDGPDSHDSARAAAAIARMFHKSDAGPGLGLSVEGSTLKRNGNILEKTIIRRMALTKKPANRTAWIDIIKDDSAPGTHKPMVKSVSEGAIEPLYKSIDMQFVSIQAEFRPDFGLLEAREKLKKALTAGGGNAAPSAKVQGSAIQKESELDKLYITTFKGKMPSKKDLKKILKSASDEDLHKIYDALNKKHLLKYEGEMKEMYENFKKSQ